MEKTTCGLIAIVILAVMQICAWILNKDGILTATLMGLIGLISGSIFGFSIAKTAEKQEK